MFLNINFQWDKEESHLNTSHDVSSIIYKTKAKFPDFTPSNMQPSEDWNNKNDVKMSISFLHNKLQSGNITINWNIVTPYTGFHLGNHIIKANATSYLKIFSPLRMKNCIVLLLGVFSLPTQNNEHHLWITAKELIPLSITHKSGLPCFSLDSIKIYLPVERYGYKILKQVSIISLPDSPKTLFYNFWVWNEINRLDTVDLEEWNAELNLLKIHVTNTLAQMNTSDDQNQNTGEENSDENSSKEN